MKLTITMSLDNVAFEDDVCGETARILEKYASQLRSARDIHNAPMNLRDHNGNIVGKASVEN